MINSQEKISVSGLYKEGKIEFSYTTFKMVGDRKRRDLHSLEGKVSGEKMSGSGNISDEKAFRLVSWKAKRM